MRDGIQLPDLSFPGMDFGARETPLNLNTLLFEGAAQTRVNLVEGMIANGALGLPQFARLEVLSLLHEEIAADLGGGKGRETAFVRIRYLRNFVAFADRTGCSLTIEELVETFRAWADSMFLRTRIKNGVVRGRNPESQRLSMRSAYQYAATIGTLLDRILNRHTSVIETTQLVFARPRKTAGGVQAEKQNLSDTFAFGNLLQDVCDGLTLQTVLESPLPIQILLRQGSILTREGDKGWFSRIDDKAKLSERYPIANLRIEAEMLMFIGQTGMNLAQASNLELRHFFYVSHLDGYHVKDHKNRRGGTVLFEIFKEYKAHFERYLDWRRTLFSYSDRLFPFVRHAGTRIDGRMSGSRIRAICKSIGIAFISPRLLRNTRVNWLLRKSADPGLTAEMAQHTKEILLSVYERPSIQRAQVEAARFWLKNEPRAKRTESVAPGACRAIPIPILEIPREAPTPDCIKPSGCLWCESHRDVDSADYVWALSSFCQLKIIELSKVAVRRRENDVPPALYVIDHIHEKLRWFEQSNDLRRTWVTEAQSRINEGNFHANFRDEITELEGA